jgi:vacuolar-type H+-ATPase subunit B/Vma2
LLYLRTDYGTLRSADGVEEISSIKLKKGQAAFRLVSEKARRVATVQVFNADPNLRDGSIRIEFI